MRSQTCLTVALAILVLGAPAFAQTTGSGAKLLPSTAAAYGDYQGDVSAISTKPLASADDLDRALDTFGGRNSDQLSSGWISYSAMIAAQDKEFAASVREIDAAYGSARVVDGMRADISYARSLKGGDRALQSALTANTQDTGRISSAAAFVKEQAYKLQNVAWGKSRLKDPAGEATKLNASARAVRPITDTALQLFSGPDLSTILASAAAPSATAASASVWDRLSIITASAPATALSAIVPASAGPELKVAPAREGTANRIVTLAALHVLEADAAGPEAVKFAMKDAKTQDCIDWSQLQLQACVSAAYTRADLSFCLAEHAISDPGSCFADVTR